MSQDSQSSAPLANLVGIWNTSDTLDRVLEERQVGAPSSVRPLLLAGLSELVAPLLVVVPRSRDAEALVAELHAWVAPEQVELLPAWEVLPGEAQSPTLEAMGRRIRVAHELSSGSAPRILVAGIRGLLQKLSSHLAAPMTLETGQQLDLSDLEHQLVDLGYERNYLVERPGEFSVRGGILDVYPPGEATPVRADLFGDELSSLKRFGVSSQRSGEVIERVVIHAARELLLTPEVRQRATELLETAEEDREDIERIAAGLTFSGMEAHIASLVDDLEPVTAFMGAGRVVLLDPKQCRDRANDFIEQAHEWGGSKAIGLYAEFENVIPDESIEVWAYGRGGEGLDLDVRGWDEDHGRPDRLAKKLSQLDKRKATIVVAGGSLARRAGEILAEHGSIIPQGVAELAKSTISEASLPRGFLLQTPGIDLALVGEDDLFGSRRPAPRLVEEAPARPAALLLELGPGDYVVHDLYGVGKYHGMVTRHTAGVLRDYLVIEFAKEDRLYVPTDQLDAVSKYSGGEAPRLNRLGTGDWEKSKSRARKAVADVAGELAVLYAKRQQSQGHEFSEDTPWQGELEDAFPFVETPDQARAIDQVKQDMQGLVPMDRLICGDVGYGKTEIAVRAAFKAVQDSKQVAVLVPTTILAQQHHQTFRERFAPFPVEVRQLSRFLSSAEQQEVVEGLGTGKVDVVIGTHRMLQADVKFNDLGLLVIDEEHRFGVMHKESIKKLKESVDAMTLTATPIPRTLEMSLTGVRDLSLVDTPPPNRRPVLTYVGPSEDRMLTAALRRELAREGQVFYVHNRVRSIKGAARRISSLLPGARVDIAHGQMNESQLERVMVDVWDGKIDVLVCTTIIESGLDIPTMNTLIVERADLLGLAQLYQLRGRVGRAAERAYAYLLFPDERALSEEAHERLKTLSEFTELGSGFKIALRDLEIRGAGNILGAQQSGHIAAVGFDLYARMMNETVAQMKGEAIVRPPDVLIDLPEDAYIPDTYIERESLRIEAYRLVERVRGADDAALLAEEFEDRYGPLSKPVRQLLEVAKLRAYMLEVGLREVTARDGIYKFKGAGLSAEQQERLIELEPDAQYKEITQTMLLPAPNSQLAVMAQKRLRAILSES